MVLIEKENINLNIETRIKNGPINRSIRTKTEARIKREITRVNTEIKTKTDTNIVPVPLRIKRNMKAIVKTKRKRVLLVRTRSIRALLARIKKKRKARTRNIIINRARVLKIKTSKKIKIDTMIQV